jgi:nucleotide-binding universal stress UspA family protein
MTKRLTVGFDGSDASMRAVMWAAAEADRRGAQLDIVSCFTTPPATHPRFMTLPSDVEGIRAETDAALRAIAARVTAAHPKLVCTAQVIFGSPGVELVHASARSDLLVVGTTGAGSVEAWLLGSVAHTAARTSTVPVVMVPAMEPAPLVGRIVLGVDDSASADHALDWATDAADDRGAGLVIVHAWQYQYALEPGSMGRRDVCRVDAALVLQRAVERRRARGRGPVSAELIEGPAAEVLVKQALDADLVVVGSRGRGALRSSVFGSVAHSVAAGSARPTVVVRGGSTR